MNGQEIIAKLRQSEPALRAGRQSRGAVRLASIYRHDYEDVAAQYVWDTVQIDLPPLRVVIERELGIA